MAAAAALAAPAAEQRSLDLNLRLDPIWHMQGYARLAEPKPGAGKRLAKKLRRKSLKKRSQLILQMAHEYPKLLCEAMEEELKVFREAKKEIKRLGRKLKGVRVQAEKKRELRRSIKKQERKMKRAVDDDIARHRLEMRRAGIARLQALGAVPN